MFLDRGDSTSIAPDGIGSVVEIDFDNRTLIGRVDGGSNYLSQSECSAHFGLSDTQVIDELRVLWTDGSMTVLSDVSANQTLTIEADKPSIGANYCAPASINSSGSSGQIAAFGSALVSSNSVRLDATRLAFNQFGYFLNSQTSGLTNPPGSQGNLCLSGAIGRYNGNVLNTGPTGEFSLQLDLPLTPTPAGFVAVSPGETWYFTTWFRDNNPGPTSNFTDGIGIMFM